MLIKSITLFLKIGKFVSAEMKFLQPLAQQVEVTDEFGSDFDKCLLHYRSLCSYMK